MITGDDFKKTSFDDEGQRKNFCKEIGMLRRSRDIVLDVLFQYPDNDKIVISEKDFMKLKRKMIKKHFEWLVGNRDFITIEMLDNFFSVADDFSLMAEDYINSLAEKPDKMIPSSIEKFIESVKVTRGKL